MSSDGFVESSRIQLAQRVVCGIGKIDDDEIEAVGVGIDPRESVCVDDVNLRREEGFLVQRGQHGVGREQLCHFWIEIDQGHTLDLGIFENLADGQSVSSAEHQNVAGNWNRRQPGMDQRLVIAVFIAGAELQMAAEEKPDVVLEASEDNVLITSVAGEDDLVGVDVVFGCGGNAFGFRQTDGESAKDYHAKGTQRSHRGDLAGKEEGAPQRYKNIDYTEQHGRAHQPEIGHQQDGEQK